MKKILLIEDNAEMRENISEILELANYQVESAENGKIGIERARNFLPDLILCDVMMPELDGFGVLHALGKDASTSSIPFIFLTAKADKLDFRKGMNLGADDYLTKPFDDAELLNVIELRLKKKEAMVLDLQKNLESLVSYVDDARTLEEFKKIVASKNIKLYRKKQHIIQEGFYPNYLYHINSGKVKSVKMNEDGKEYITSIKKAGDFLGYMDLFQESVYNYSAEVLEDAEIALISKQDFFFLINTNKEVSNRFIKLLANNLSDTEDKLINLAYNTVRRRVAEILLDLKKTYDENNQTHVSFSITRDDLASMIGTATETVIRTLSEFKDEGSVALKGSLITILDEKKLQKVRF
jgi:CheY-like chemotaxis protein